MKKKILSVLMILVLVVSCQGLSMQPLVANAANTESEINGVALTQNAVTTSNGASTYQEAGLIVSWFQNQVTDISQVKWIALEYYNPTGAAWPFIFKLQCGGQQVYTNNSAVQYTLLDNDFQETGKQSTSGYIAPGVSTSGWLVFPREIFGGIDSLSGVMEAMYLLLPCQYAAQNNVTELHFGRIMSYTEETITDYSQGTVVADLSTWTEDLHQYTYAHSAVGDGNLPLVAIRKVSKPVVVEPDPTPDETEGVESRINGVVLKQNAATGAYNEAGLMVNWFENQVMDISAMKWIAIEYYNPTGAAWPFVFKLQCGGQQVYTTNSAAQYILLDGNFQETGKQSTSAYVVPDVSTSGWLVFPREIFGGIDSLSGVMEAMYLLLPCQYEAQNNVTELHFGRIMSYTDSVITDYSQGTVVADLSTWSEELYQYTYAATGVGNGNAPLATINKTAKISIPVSGIALNKSETTIQVGESETLTATITPADADDKSVVWSSSDDSIATVNSAGVVTAFSTGKVIITATSSDVTKSATCAVTVNGGMLFTDSYMEKEFNYCPSIMQVDDNTRYIYYCANKDSAQVYDHIYCRQGTKGANGTWTYGAKTLVLSPTPGAYDSMHCCDPSVIKGEFNYNGMQYSYLMAYTGNSDQVNNKVGLAVSNNPLDGWVKIPNAFRAYSGDSSHWGYGQPSLISIDKKGEVLLFYSVGSTASYTQVETWDLTNLNNPQLKTSIPMTQNGLTDMNGAAGDYLTNGDFAYDPVKNRYFCISDAHPFPDSSDVPEFVTQNFRVTYLNANGTYLGEVFTTTEASEGKRWHTLGTVGPDETGRDRNSNGGIVTDAYGWILSSDKLEVSYSGSMALDKTSGDDWNWLWSYRIYPWTFLVEERDNVINSEINGVVLTQNSVNTTATYQEAGLMVNWFENQVTDISKMEWIAVEYYNPTGAAWPFIFKLQSGGQQVYTSNTAAQYILLDSSFQVVGTRGASAYITPGVGTSGWLVFPRASFAGIDNLTGALEAMFLLLPCQAANQNNVTELHFGRIMSYTEKTITDYSKGTVVADLATWYESYYNTTYAATGTGDNGVPLITVKYADEVLESFDANGDTIFNSCDLVRVKRYMANSETPIQLYKVDFDLNQGIDSADLTQVRKRLIID